MITGMTLMCTGVLLMFVIVPIHWITEIVSGNIFANLIIGATLLIIGFIEKQLWFCQKLSNGNNCSGLNFTDNKIINLDLKTSNDQLSDERSNVSMLDFCTNSI